jgi:tRNA threonylcarbamoyladenosine biosynthesis protein TsaE
MFAKKRRIVSRSPEETQQIGFQIGQEVEIPCVVLLRGALGTGKTTLARGIALGLGIEDGSLVSSPSFTLVNIYRGRCPIYHVDLYRLESERDIRSTGLDEFLGLDGVTIVEWGERLPALPDDAVVVDLEDAGGDTRVIETRSRERNRTKLGMIL